MVEGIQEHLEKNFGKVLVLYEFLCEPDVLMFRWVRMAWR
jgi:hypothetical protein